ncbi:MAG: hypothetical protein GX275_12175 [Clostridiales bacterium]|nr:hypothetical protein [Clostridiales bacterium]
MPSPEKFQKSLVKYGLSEDIIEQINKGFEGVVDKSPKKVKAAYFKQAIDILTESISHKKLQDILEWNACCKSGAREKASKAFAKEYEENTLEEKLEKIKSIPNMGEPVINEDGTITVNAVSLFDGEKFVCACSNFSGLKYDYSVSKNYCFCCAGHFLYHYEIMLGKTLKTLEIVSSPLDSDGKKPCIIRFEII